MLKKVLVLFNLLFALAWTANAQLQTGFHYKIKPGQKVYYTTNKGKSKISKSVCDTKLSTNIVQEGAILKLDFWSIIANTDKCKGDNTKINSADALGEDSYYFLQVEKRTSMGTPTSYIVVPYATWEVGATTIPFKYRFGNKSKGIPNDASVGVNAGIYVGRKWGRTGFMRIKIERLIV